MDYTELKKRLKLALAYSPDSSQEYYPVFQNRFTRTPGAVLPKLDRENQIEGQYSPSTHIQEILNHNLQFGPALDDDSAIGQYNLRDQFDNTRKGVIKVIPQATSNTISHEAAHSIYDQAGLSKYISDLNEQVPHYIKTIMQISPIYRQNMQQDPSTLSDEALGFTMNDPAPVDEKYMNYAASKISDPTLKNRLVQLFQHAKQMNLIRQKQLYGK